eukprot:6193675-Pleurochrysis_carterae.AAC.1
MRAGCTFHINQKALGKPHVLAMHFLDITVQAALQISRKLHTAFKERYNVSSIVNGRGANRCADA